MVELFDESLVFVELFDESLICELPESAVLVEVLVELLEESLV